MGFKENEVFETKEYSIVKQIRRVLKRQKVIDQYRVENHFIDLYFSEHKLGIEIDEDNHTSRSETKEHEREEIIKNAGIMLIRTNPDKEDFEMFDEISEIQDFIYESGLK